MEFFWGFFFDFLRVFFGVYWDLFWGVCDSGDTYIRLCCRVDIAAGKKGSRQHPYFCHVLHKLGILQHCLHVMGGRGE